MRKSKTKTFTINGRKIKAKNLKRAIKKSNYKKHADLLIAKYEETYYETQY